MLTPEQLAYCADDMIKLYSQLDEAIVRDIARRITKAGTMTETGRLQINALQNVGMLYDDILKTVSSYTGKSESILFDLFENAALWSVEYDMDIYTANGLNPIPLNMSPAAMQILEAGYIKTNGNINNLTRTTAVTSQTSFIDACTFAEMKAESGAFSYEQAIADAIKQLAIPGGCVLYPSGHKDKIDVAVRRNVMTGVGQTTGQICLGYAQEMGCDLMEITAHCGARPSHAQWQGQIVSLSGRKGYLSLSDIGYGTGDGFKGWNCRHDWYPYFEGSPRMYSEKDIEELNAENIKFPDGSMHTYYEAEQYQRAYERKIRETKRILAAQDECIKNTSSESLKRAVQNDFDKFAVKLKKQEAKLNDFCDKTGLLKDNARVQKYGFGRSAAQKAVQVNKRKVKSAAANSAVRNTGRVLEFNDKASFRINIEGYNQNVIDGLSSASNNVAKLGSKNGLEHLVLVDLSNGSHVYSEVGNDVSVGFEDFRKYIKDHPNQQLAFVHNHNTDGCFSETDMRTLLTTDNIQMFVAVRIDGIIYVAEKTQAAPNYALFDKLFPDEISELNSQYKNGIITAGERTRKREEIIVDGLLKKFTKGLIEIE